MSPLEEALWRERNALRAVADAKTELNVARKKLREITEQDTAQPSHGARLAGEVLAPVASPALDPCAPACCRCGAAKARWLLGNYGPWCRACTDDVMSQIAARAHVRLVRQRGAQ